MALSEVAYSLIGFFMNPFNAGLLIVSLALALITFFYWKEKNKISLIYLHIFFLILPLLYYAVAVPCAIPFVQGLLSFCSVMITRLVIFLIPVALAGTVALGYFVAPMFYKKIYKAKEIRNKFLENNAEKSRIKNIKIFLIDTAKPVAFALKNSIFVSVGMFELLTEKEIEAVLLHELGHIYHNSSLSKFSAFFIRTFSPLSRFVALPEESSVEEEKANSFAAEMHGNYRFINRAKRKIGVFVQ